MARPMDVTALDSPGGYREYSGGIPRDFYAVEISDPHGTGVGAEITLDGVPMKHVVRYAVDVGLNRPTKVTVEFYARSVNRKESAST